VGIASQAFKESGARQLLRLAQQWNMAKSFMIACERTRRLNSTTTLVNLKHSSHTSIRIA
jgi:hypothetical protein